MSVFDLSKKSDRGVLAELFQGHFRRQDIIPIFGSGFTRGLQAVEGKVPSVQKLKEELIDIISGIENYLDDDRAELDQMKLSDLAEVFWSVLEREGTPQSYRDRFDLFMEHNFCGVHDLPVQHHGLINCRWRYL